MAVRRENAKHLQAYEAWYDADRSFHKLTESYSETEKTLRNWADRYGWHERADKRDMEATAKAEREAISRRVKLIEDQRKAGQALRGRGMEYLAQNKLEKARDAITAIDKGIALERQAEGLPDWIGTILNASDSDLYALEQALTRGETTPTPSSTDGEGTPRSTVSSNGSRA